MLELPLVGFRDTVLLDHLVRDLERLVGGAILECPAVVPRFQ